MSRTNALIGFASCSMVAGTRDENWPWACLARMEDRVERTRKGWNAMGLAKKRLVMPGVHSWILAASALLGVSCVTPNQEYPTVPAVDLNRFMGDWYVQGHTPLFIDEDSSEQRESYQLDAKGGIQTRFSFKKKGDWHHYNPYGTIFNEKTKAHWKMQFIWPFSSDFLIVRLDLDYAVTVISVPDKDKIWIMTRQRQMQEKAYQAVVDDLARENYPVASIRRVPQSLEPIPRGK